MDNLEALQEAFEHAISLAPEAQNEYIQQLKNSVPNLHQHRNSALILQLLIIHFGVDTSLNSNISAIRADAPA